MNGSWYVNLCLRVCNNVVTIDEFYVVSKQDAIESVIESSNNLTPAWKEQTIKLINEHNRNGAVEDEYGYKIIQSEDAPISLDLLSIVDELRAFLLPQSKKSASELKKSFGSYGIFTLFFMDMRVRDELILDDVLSAFAPLIYQYSEKKSYDFYGFCSLVSLLETIDVLMGLFYQKIMKYILDTSQALVTGEEFIFVDNGELEAIDFNNFVAFKFLASGMKLKYFIDYVKKNRGLEKEDERIDFAKEEISRYITLVRDEVAARAKQSNSVSSNAALCHNSASPENIEEMIEKYVKNNKERLYQYVSNLFEENKESGSGSGNGTKIVLMQEENGVFFAQASNRYCARSQILELATGTLYKVNVNRRPPDGYPKCRGRVGGGDKKQSKEKEQENENENKIDDDIGVGINDI